jgi:hypothetical protein
MAAEFMLKSRNALITQTKVYEQIRSVMNDVGGSPWGNFVLKYYPAVGKLPRRGVIFARVL